MSSTVIKKEEEGIPQWSSGQDSTFFAEELNSIPDLGNKIPQATEHGLKKKKEECMWVNKTTFHDSLPHISK